MAASAISVGSFRCALACGHTKLVHYAEHPPMPGGFLHCSRCHHDHAIVDVAVAHPAPGGQVTPSRSFRRRPRRSMLAPSPPTPREVEILLLAASGMTNRQIARSLGSSIGTVSTHLYRVNLKLCARSRADAVRRASEAGWL